MYYCLNCESRFDELVQSVWEGIETDVCPLCKIDDYTVLVPCEQCSEPKEDSGEKYCVVCKDFTYKEISQLVQHLIVEGNYDKELVINMMEKYIEDN